MDIGDDRLEDFSVTSWYLYLPVPAYEVFDYTVVADLTMQSTKLGFKEGFSLKADFERRGYSAIGVGLFPSADNKNFA